MQRPQLPQLRKKLNKYSQNDFTEMEIDTVCRVLQAEVELKRENMPDILRIYDPYIDQKVEVKKMQFDSDIGQKGMGIYERCFENEGIICVQMSQLKDNKSEYVQIPLSPQCTTKYFNTSLSLQELKIGTLEGCLLTLAKATRAFYQRIQQKLQKKEKTGLSVTQLSSQSAQRQMQNKERIQSSQQILMKNSITEKITELQQENCTQRQRVRVLEEQSQGRAQLPGKRGEIDQKWTQKMGQLEKENLHLRNQIKMIEALNQGELTKINHELSTAKADYDVLLQEKKKLVEQKEKLSSKNCDIRTKISHLEQKYSFTEHSNDTLLGELAKLHQFINMDEEERKLFQQTEQKEYRTALNSIYDLQQKFIAKEQQRLDQEAKHKERLETLIKTHEEEVKQLRVDIRKQLQESIAKQMRKDFQETKKIDFSNILLELQYIFMELQRKEQKVKKLEEQNTRLVQENTACAADNRKLLRLTDLRQKAIASQKEFDRNLGQIKDYLKLIGSSSQLYLEQSQLRSSELKGGDMPWQGKVQLTSHWEQVQALKEQLAQKESAVQRLSFAQKMLDENEKRAEELEHKLKAAQEECRTVKMQRLELQKRAVELQSQVKIKPSTILTVSPILEGQRTKIDLLVSYIEKFTEAKIMKSELKFRHDPLNRDFGYYFTEKQEQFPFVVLFKLDRSERVMGIFSTGLITGTNVEGNPRVFVFGLEGKGCMYGKYSSTAFSPAARYIDNSLIFGNSQIYIRNQTNQRSFQLSTSILGQQYFSIKNVLQLTGEPSSGTFKFEQMEIHRIWF